MSTEFSPRITFITGAGSGIGRETAQEFGRLGANVNICDVDETVGKETGPFLGEPVNPQ